MILARHATLFVLVVMLSCSTTTDGPRGQGQACPIVPAPRSYVDLGVDCPIDAGLSIIVEDPRMNYAAEVLRDEIRNRFHVEPTMNDPNARRKIILEAFPDVRKSWGEERFEISSEVNGDRIAIAIRAEGLRGIVYGATALLQLMATDANGKGVIRLANVSDWPSVPVRAYYVLSHRLGEGIGSWPNLESGKNIQPGTLRRKEVRDYYLDWIVRHRGNLVYYETGHAVPLPDDLKDLIAEAHRRGLMFFAGVRYIAGSGNNAKYLCYTDENDVATITAIYRKYLDLGVDGVAYLADDIRKENMGGHCPRCIAKFGGLAGEQIFMLKTIAAMARERGIPDDRIYFCPTYYSTYTKLRENADFRAYYAAFAADETARNIPFFLTYYDQEQVKAFTTTYGLKYIWWYNGPRWYSYWYKKKWGPIVFPPEADALYYPLFYGWEGIPRKPGLPAGEADETVRRKFADVRKLTSVFWNCNGGSDGVMCYEYSHAIWGHYAWNPDAFDQAASERAIFEIIYGREGYPLLKELNDLCHRAAMVYFPNALKSTEVVELCDRATALLDKLERVRSDHERATGGRPAVMHTYARIGLTYYRNAIKLMRAKAGEGTEY